MKFGYIVLAALLTSCVQNEIIPVSGKSDMCFTSLSKTWDEGIPLGNATVGA